MNCDEVLELLSPSLDGELTDQQEAQVQAHLDQCPSCRALMAELAAIHEGCGAWEADPPPELTQRVLSGLPAQKAPKPAKLLYWKRWGTMAAAVALIALAGWRMPGLLRSGSADLPQTAESAVTRSATAGGTDQPLGKSDDADGVPLPDPASTLPPYVNGEAFSANTGLPASDSSEDEEVALGGGLQRGTETMKGVADYGGAAMDAAAPEETPQPAAKAAAPAPAYFSYTAADTADALPSPEFSPEQPQAAPTMIRSAFIQANSGNDTAMDTAVAEFPPATGSGEENIAVEPLEELYALTVSAPDSSQVYCGILTLAQGTPVGSYPAQVKEDGQIWYTLPADDFAGLLQELDAQNVSYQLRLEGPDVSPSARQGLLIVTG